MGKYLIFQAEGDALTGDINHLDGVKFRTFYGETVSIKRTSSLGGAAPVASLSLGPLAVSEI